MLFVSRGPLTCCGGGVAHGGGGGGHWVGVGGVVGVLAVGGGGGGGRGRGQEVHAVSRLPHWRTCFGKRENFVTLRLVAVNETQ